MELVRKTMNNFIAVMSMQTIGLRLILVSCKLWIGKVGYSYLNASTLPLFALCFQATKSFWKQKFEEIKNLEWSDLELQHIQKAENFLIVNEKWIFAKNLSNEDLDKIDSFFYSWQKYAKEKLNWDQAVIYGIAGTGYPMMDKKGTLQINKKKRLYMDNLHSNEGEDIKTRVPL